MSNNGLLSAGEGSDDGWLNTSLDEEDEERLLQRELLKQKKKLKKRQDLQEWSQTKQLRQSASYRLEDEERRQLDEAAFARELKRAERAKKQKLKIDEYRSNIRSEAEKIDELVRLGIDPVSLLP